MTTEYYVDNVRDQDDNFFGSTNVIVMTDGSDIVTEFYGSIDDGEIIQIGDLGNIETYRVLSSVPGSPGTVTLDRNCHKSTMIDLWQKDSDGSESAPYPTINQALLVADGNARVKVKWSSGGYTLTDSDQMKEVLDPQGEGLWTNNHFLVMEGYKISIGDMRWGLGNYQSPMDALMNGIDTDKIVTIDGDGGITNLLSLDGISYLVFRNLYFQNATGIAIAVANTPGYVLFDHCFFSDVDQVIEGICNGFIFRDCFIKDLGYVGSSYSLRCQGVVGAQFLGNILDIGSYDDYGFVTGDSGEASLAGIIKGNIIIGGAFSILCRSGDNITNNVLYDVVNGIRTGFGAAQEDPVTIRNNIVVARGAADKGIVIAGTHGAVYNSHNCLWSKAGQLDNPVTNTAGGIISLGDGSIEADPMFIDPDNGDFRLKPGSPCLNTGMPTLGDGYTSMGAVSRKHRFVSKASMSNQGRMKIFR